MCWIGHPRRRMSSGDYGLVVLAGSLYLVAGFY